MLHCRLSVLETSFPFLREILTMRLPIEKLLEGEKQRWPLIDPLATLSVLSDSSEEATGVIRLQIRSTRSMYHYAQNARDTVMVLRALVLPLPVSCSVQSALVLRSGRCRSDVLGAVYC